VISGLVKAHTGFSDAAMATSMPSSLSVLVWSICVGIFLLRTAGTKRNAA
jgi:hypothetical protein